MNKPNKPDALPLNPLTALSPLDGRYQAIELQPGPAHAQRGIARRHVVIHYFNPIPGAQMSAPQS